MSHIQVIFQTGMPALVLDDPEAVMQKEIFHWQFHTLNTPVRKVRITFDQPDAAFFPRASGPPANTILKEILHGQTIWGQAPGYFTSGPPQSRPDKYTIEAFDQNGTKLDWATNDPTIRTDGP
jgi:phosphatidylethanolamine-binding protein (PEBP) family uncharacterized protein